MQLVGVYLSPFVRRIAITLNAYQMDFEQVAVSVVDGREVIKNYNGLVRIPALVLDDGDVLVDSHHIIAELDTMVDASQRLSVLGEQRRDYGQMLALLTGACEKSVSAMYEIFRRPQDKVWTDWALQCEQQAIGGLQAAEVKADAGLVQQGYLFEERLTHADILAGVAYQTLAALFAGKIDAQTFPKLSALASRLSDQPCFTAVQ